MATKEQQTSGRVPTPPTTRQQEEVYKQATENEERADAVDSARRAIRQAIRSLNEAEDALDSLS
jgi:hypothetical protein